MAFSTLLLSYLAFCGAKRRSYDYIVVGAGSSGSVVANRISAYPNASVLLLEAGERPNILSEVPNLYSYMQLSKYDWNYTVEVPSSPKYGIKAETYTMPQGKILGGTSSINAMIYTRGNKNDYDNWALNGAIGWDWKSLFPVFKKSENNQDKDIVNNGFHGTRGEMFVQHPEFRTPLAAKYIEAAEELGYKLGDVNGPEQEVFMNPQLTVHNGRRWGSSQAFTYPIEGRRNFCVLTSAFVKKVLFEGNRTIGVEVDYMGKTMKILAKKEVILSAGAIKSPQILMLSGIGPKKELEKIGIPVISDLPVGKNFHDHAIAQAYSRYINKNVSGLSLSERDYNEFLTNGKGILSDISTEAIGYVNTIKKKHSWPEAELIFSTTVQPKSFYPYSSNASSSPTTRCIAVLLRPDSRGEITLKSKDPYEHPHINPNYLSDESDLKNMAEAIKKCLQFENTTALKSIFGRTEKAPVAQCNRYISDSDEYFACIAKASVRPGYHLAGSCKMGNPRDASSVVDSNLRVIGVKGLRVADSSIMPTVASGHTHAVAVMIGEKAAEYILQKHT